MRRHRARASSLARVPTSIALGLILATVCAIVSQPTLVRARLLPRREVDVNDAASAAPGAAADARETDVRPLTSSGVAALARAVVGEPGRETAAEALLVEFFMPWCGHCQHFKPEYAAAAAAVASRVATYAVDCTKEGKLCASFGAKSFPTVMLGLPSAFAARDMDKLKTFKSKRYLAGEVVKWVDEELGSSFAKTGAGARAVDAERRDDEKRLISRGRREQAPESENDVVTSIVQSANVADLERATVEMYAQMTSEAVFVSSPNARRAFVAFLRLMSETHPLETCYRGLTNVLHRMDDIWPLDGKNTTGEIRASLTLGIRVCGASRGVDVTIVPRWVDCAASVEGLRGYTCGVWMLLHAMSVRVPASQLSNEDFINAVRGWVEYFFPCAECRQHFLGMIDGEENGFKEYETRADGSAMWLWRAHNVVNARLAEEETAPTGSVQTGSVLAKHDPKHPKIQFPSRSTCPLCYESAGVGEDSWDESHVSQFLTTHYLGEGERRALDLTAATKNAEFLMPFADASSSRFEALSHLRKALNSGEESLSVYDVFWMSTRFFIMFSLILFMAVKSGAMSLFRENPHRRPKPTRSPRAAIHHAFSPKNA
jgi:thiol oxidase